MVRDLRRAWGHGLRQIQRARGSRSRVSRVTHDTEVCSVATVRFC